jgi:K+-transporting ATPase ATPase C chain
MTKILRPALVMFTVLTLATGVAYPLVVTGAAQSLFPVQASGSLIQRDGKTIGSELIGQNFSDPGHFWGRPSATGPMPYNAAASSGANQGPLNPALVDAVKGRIEALKAADPGNTAQVPVDLVTASASGLDPAHQPGRGALSGGPCGQGARRGRRKSPGLARTANRTTTGFLIGRTQVNVLKLNLALEALR